MGKIIYSFCKDGVRIDRPLQKDIEVGDLVLNKYNSGIAGKVISIVGDAVEVQNPFMAKTDVYSIDEIELVQKGEPIATDEPVISEGAIVTLNGHKGKVLSMLGGKAQVSWEDASISEVDAKDLGYDGRVEKGGPGSGPRPEGGSAGDEHGFSKLTTEELKSKLKTHEADVERFGGTDFTLKYGSALIDEIKRREGGRVEKGGPGSGRYPAGSGYKETQDAVKERMKTLSPELREKVKLAARDIYYRNLNQNENYASIARNLKIKNSDIDVVTAILGVSSMVEKGGPGSSGTKGPGTRGGSGEGKETANYDDTIESRAKDIGMPADLFERAVELREGGVSYKDIVSDLTESDTQGREWFSSGEYQGNEFDLRQDLEEAIQPSDDNEIAIVRRYSEDKNVVKMLKGGPGSGRHKEGDSVEVSGRKIKLGPFDGERFHSTIVDGSAPGGKVYLSHDEIKSGQKAGFGNTPYANKMSKGGAGSGRFSEEVKASNVKLGVARHLRRQGVLARIRKLRKGGPGSGRKPEGGQKWGPNGERPEGTSPKGQVANEIARQQGRAKQDKVLFDMGHTRGFQHGRDGIPYRKPKELAADHPTAQGYFTGFKAGQAERNK